MSSIFLKQCDFIAGAGNLGAIPPITLPEIAFIGRSNVGKSSLINALTGRNKLARISQHPGCTQQLNFFSIADKLILVDMPGYGFAKVSKTQKKAWEDLIRGYLSGRPSLQRVCVLLDARHEIKPSDIEMMTMLDEAAVTYQLVFTKADKAEILPDVAALIAKHPAAYPETHLTSAETGQGIMELREILAEFSVKE